MIARDGDGIAAACDFCAAGAESFDDDDFAWVVERLKALGWRIERAGGGWEHRCPDCRAAAPAGPLFAGGGGT